MQPRRGGSATMLAAVLLVSVTACQEMVTANETDHERIDVMRSDPVFNDSVDGSVREGSLLVDEGTPVPNGFTGYLDPWHGEPPPPDDIAGPMLRGPVLEVMESLRDSGWTIVGTRCTVEIDRDGDTDKSIIHYGWYAHGYRFHDDVPYVFVIDGSFPVDLDSRPSELRVMMTAPFHADPDTETYLRDPPPALPAGDSCIVDGEHINPDRTSQAPQVVTNGPSWNELSTMSFYIPFVLPTSSP
jgi:hypothetical protein